MSACRALPPASTTDPAPTPIRTTSARPAEPALAILDWIRVGLAGNLRDYTFRAVRAHGHRSTGGLQRPADGIHRDPIEAVNYCSVHDNQDLFDAVQLKSSFADSIAARARRQDAVHEPGHARARAFLSSRPATTCCAPKTWTRTATIPATGSTKSTGVVATANWGIGLPDRQPERRTVADHDAAA